MEPERRIEKLLRAYANRRRREGGPPPELNPVTRRLLQSEAARRAAAPRDSDAQSGWLSFFRVKWWWTLAGATAAVVVSAWFIYSLNQPEKTESLAAAHRVEPSVAEVQERDLQKKAAPAVIPATPAEDKAPQTLARSAEERSKSATAVTTREPANAPATASARAVTPSVDTAVAPVASPPALQGAAAAPPAPPSTFRLAAATPSLKAESLKQAEPQTAQSTLGQAANSAASAATPTVTLADNLAVAPPNADSAKLNKDIAGATVATGTLAAPTAPVVAPALTLNSTALAPGAAPSVGANALAESAAANQQRFYRKGTALNNRAGGGFGGAGGGGGFKGGNLNYDVAAESAPAVSVVLTNFVAVRTSNLLQIFDADGSIYQGYVQGDAFNAANALNSANTLNGANAANAANTAASDATGARAAYSRADATPNNSALQNTQLFAGYAFTVNGTNVTLNRMVNFSGVFAPQPAGTTVNPAFYNRTLVPNRAALQNVAFPSVSGVLTIEGETPVRIDATPVPPKN